jgi:hypothetical protein
VVEVVVERVADSATFTIPSAESAVVAVLSSVTGSSGFSQSSIQSVSLTGRVALTVKGKLTFSLGVSDFSDKVGQQVDSLLGVSDGSYELRALGTGEATATYRMLLSLPLPANLQSIGRNSELSYCVFTYLLVGRSKEYCRGSVRKFQASSRSHRSSFRRRSE